MRLTGNFEKNSKKNSEFFFSIFSFLRAFVVSSCRKSGFRVFLSLRYGADLGRSRLVIILRFESLFRLSVQSDMNCVSSSFRYVVRGLVVKCSPLVATNVQRRRKYISPIPRVGHRISSSAFLSQHPFGYYLPIASYGTALTTTPCSPNKVLPVNHRRDISSVCWRPIGAIIAILSQISAKTTTQTCNIIFDSRSFYFYYFSSCIFLTWIELHIVCRVVFIAFSGYAERKENCPQ